MSTLFEITDASKMVTHFLETDQFPPEFTDLEIITRELPYKLDSYKYVLDELEKDEGGLRKRAAELEAAARTLKNQREALKERIKYAMISLDKTEMLGNDYRFKLSETKPKLLIDVDNLDGSYLEEQISFVPDKDKILLALNEGKPVQGAELEQGYSLRTYINTRTYINKGKK